MTKKILVGVKRAIDYAVQIRVKPDGSGVLKDQSVKQSMNPFCEIALEEAVRLKEKKLIDEVITFSIGPGGKGTEDVLRNALSKGADRAIQVSYESEIDMEPLNVAKVAQKLAEQEEVSAVFLGKQAIDGDQQMTPQILSSLLGWPSASFACKVDLDGEKMIVDREIDGGLETVELQTPCVVSADLRLNTPRYAKLKSIMQARKKKIESFTAEDLIGTVDNHVTIEKVVEPEKRKAGQMVADVDELFDRLQNEARVI